jgi:hypothetical protein
MLNCELAMPRGCRKCLVMPICYVQRRAARYRGRFLGTVDSILQSCWEASSQIVLGHARCSYACTSGVCPHIGVTLPPKHGRFRPALAVSKWATNSLHRAMQALHTAIAPCQQCTLCLPNGWSAGHPLWHRGGGMNGMPHVTQLFAIMCTMHWWLTRHSEHSVLVHCRGGVHHRGFLLPACLAHTRGRWTPSDLAAQRGRTCELSAPCVQAPGFAGLARQAACAWP